jgi:hypothetical protein
LKFRESSVKVGRIIREGEAEWIMYFKERQSFVKVFEVLIQCAREGFTLLSKETFPSKKKLAAIQEKIVITCELVVDAIEKVSRG